MKIFVKTIPVLLFAATLIFTGAASTFAGSEQGQIGESAPGLDGKGNPPGNPDPHGVNTNPGNGDPSGRSPADDRG